MSVYDFMEFDEPIKIEKSNNFSDTDKILLIDGHNLAYRTVYSAIFSDPEDNNKFLFWRHMFLNSFFGLITQFKPRRLVMAFDVRPSWRYEIFDQYKSNRKEARDKSVVDFEKFFPVLDRFIKEIKETFSTIYLMQVENCEADDVIAILCKKVLKNNDITIVSGDGDFRQLIKPNIKLYDSQNKKFVESLNPRRDLDIKVLMGDKSDAIPAVKSKVGEKTAMKILDNGLEKFLDESKEYKDNYIRNKQLIDLDFIPEKIEKKIINTYDTYQKKEIIGVDVIDFFMRNKLVKLMGSWDSFSDNIKSLI